MSLLDIVLRILAIWCGCSLAVGVAWWLYVEAQARRARRRARKRGGMVR